MNDLISVITFDERTLLVYGTFDKPLFLVRDISNMLGYSTDNSWNIAQLCEEDEKLKLPILVAGQKRIMLFVTESGLYNILSQSRKSTARKWRRIIHNRIIEMRLTNNKSVSDKFTEWNEDLDGVYFDDEHGVMMMSKTVEGGDVVQIPVSDVGGY